MKDIRGANVHKIANKSGSWNIISVRRDSLELISEWFNALQDVHRDYLETKDYALAKEIYEALGRRIPREVLCNCSERE